MSTGAAGYRVSSDAACPGCGNPSLLPESAPPGAYSCSTCAGWFFERDSAYHFLVEDLGVDGASIGRLLSSPGARTRRCAACQDETREILVRGHGVDLCGRCGAAFFDASAVGELSRGRFGRSSPRPVSGVQRRPAGVAPSGEEPPLPDAPLNPFGDPEHSGPLPVPPGFRAPPPPSAATPAAPSASTPAVAPAAASGTTSLAPPAEEESRSSPPPATRARRAPSPTGKRTVLLAAGAAAVMLVVAGGVVAAFALSGEDEAVETPPEQTAEERYARYMRHYPFGGQTVVVWGELLTRFRPGGPEENPQLYALTKARAERVGLLIHEEAGGVRVEIEQRLVQRLLKRLELQ